MLPSVSPSREGARQERSASGSCRSTTGPDVAFPHLVDEPGIEIGVQLLNPPVDLFAERDAVELVEQGAMEALADSVGLRAFSLGPGVVDVLDREVELVFMAFPAARRP